MDLELAYHELLNCLHHWFNLFRSLDPLAKPFFQLLRRFPPAKFLNIRLLKLHVPANIFLKSATFMALKSLLFFCFDILNLETIRVSKILSHRKNIYRRELKIAIRSSYTCSTWVRTDVRIFARFVYIRSHVTLHVKSSAQKVNYRFEAGTWYRSGRKM